MKQSIPISLRQTADYLKKNGWKNTLYKVPEYITLSRHYQIWRKKHTPTARMLEEQRVLSQKMEKHPLFSILVPACDTDPLQLKQMAESVFLQTYGRWELCIADGSTKPSKVEAFFTDYAKKHDIPAVSSVHHYEDTRYSVLSFSHGSGRVLIAPVENLGIAGNTNVALSLASGDYIVLLDHDDLLSPDALFELAQAVCRDPSADVLYSDEDMVSPDGTFFHNPNFKPDYNPDLLRSCNYITHLYAVRRSLALSVGGFSVKCDGSQDYDFILKTVEKASGICHLPKVLYHWRIHPASVAADSDNKAYAYDSAVRALYMHYQRCGISTSITKDQQPGFYLTDYGIIGKPAVSVLLYHCDASLKEGLINLPESALYTLEFPASVAEARGEYVLVLRQVCAITPDLIPTLLSNCIRPEIGIAVPRILSFNEKIIEAGLLYNSEGEILSPFAGKDPNYPGYHRFAVCQHQISLAGPHCFMTSLDNLRRNWQAKADVSKGSGRREPYNRMAQFCFQTIQDQKLITMLPAPCARLTAEGSKEARTGNKRIAENSYLIAHPVDPCYTPNFSQKHPYRF